MARPASPHRRRRTLRVTAASALLLLSVVGCVVTLLAAAGAATAVLPLLTLTVIVAALLLHTELRVERAEHAADRLAQAQSFTETFVARSAEHHEAAVAEPHQEPARLDAGRHVVRHDAGVGPRGLETIGQDERQ